MRKLHISFLGLLTILLLLSAAAAFYRYIILGDYIIFTSEDTVVESIGTQIYQTIEEGL